MFIKAVREDLAEAFGDVTEFTKRLELLALGFGMGDVKIRYLPIPSSKYWIVNIDDCTNYIPLGADFDSAIVTLASWVPPHILARIEAQPMEPDEDGLLDDDDEIIDLFEAESDELDDFRVKLDDEQEYVADLRCVHLASGSQTRVWKDRIH